ncbi:uracil-DNA glycosylase family protein [Marinomonas pollencensis]|uniref:Uracil-DNA glycosylase n=1 Tax=Marinomonas pollencensis TaxID=491954 RepID=A0A3E0DFB8_9GAMM|nr:uracil-DNA glycosylase family protein [Marinomonas pollencensis]REG81324.1 uracil-DNA glycosylase [Marinomonas pollencensis]
MQSCAFSELKSNILACRECVGVLPLGPKPILQIHPQAKLLIVGQAPGRRAHDANLAFDDLSGDRLRDWLGISKELFYDATNIALVPMGFCFPGTGRSGDLAPRKECAEKWRHQLLNQLTEIQLTVILGRYAQAYHLETRKKTTLTEQVKASKYWLEQGKIVLPHPSPRNNRWLAQNPWFEKDILPLLREHVAQLLATPSA